MTERIVDKLFLLLEQPNLGHHRSDTPKDVLSYVLTPYVIFYIASPSVLKVVRVLHGARNIESIFAKRRRGR